MLTQEQKQVIQEIRQEQEKSFLELLEGYSERIYNELLEEGYDVDIGEISTEIAIKLKQWAKVRDYPDRFLNLLDGQELGIIKHYLINDYNGNPHTRGLWKKLNLFEELTDRLN